MDRRNRHGLVPLSLALASTSGSTSLRGRKLKPGTSNRIVRSLSLDECRETKHKDCPDGVLPSGVAPVDIFIISRLNDSSSYFFTWFCKRYRIRIGVRDLGGKEEIQRCPICLDPCTKSIELQCGHAFCRSCLTTSAANNINSCALCRREQVINPELLRARFDEQRMLNLAQRLAIPPPVPSRPSTCGATIPAGGNRETKDMQANVLSTQNLGHEEKDLQSGGAGVASRPLNVESMTTRGHLLFGPWGDVGAMSAGDLRRRWKLSGMEISSAPDAATVGAASSAELRSSWRDHQHLSPAFTYMRNEREVLGTPRQVSRDTEAKADVSSCSGDAEPHGDEMSPEDCSFQVANPDSPCAGGSSLGELSSRWRTLARVSSGRCSAGDDNSDEISICDGSHSTKNASIDRERIAELQISPGQVSAHVSPAPGMLATPLIHRSYSVLDDDVGSLAGACLQSRWRNALMRGEHEVAAPEVRALAAKFSLVRGAQRVGDTPNADLSSRWIASRSMKTVGATEARALAASPSVARGAQSVGDMSNTELTSRWIALRSMETVGATKGKALASRFLSARGAQGVGDESSAELTSRWTAAQSKETVGATEAGALAASLSRTRGAQSVQDAPHLDLRSRWDVSRSIDTIGATKLGALAARFWLARGAQGVGDASNADVTSRWTATWSEETVGATEVGALAARFSLARGIQGVGDTSNASLTSRWLASQADETVGATEIGALIARLSSARGAQGVGHISHADLSSRWTVPGSKEVGLGRAEHCCARMEEGRGGSGHVHGTMPQCKGRTTHVPGWCVVDGTAPSSNEVNRTYALGEQAAGDVSTSVICDSWRAAAYGVAPIG